MNKRYDELFREIGGILREDWAGKDVLGDRLDLRYYNTSVGQAWHDHRLDDLTFLRYMNEMLAATGDRHLRLAMRPTAEYTPWCCGFFARRYEDSLYVTALRGETRLRVGDRIPAINGGSPAEHRARIQKNFFYAETSEREDWNGLLKMAEHIDVEHLDGSCERLSLARHPLTTPAFRPRVTERKNGVIVDLRNVPDLSDAELLDLLPPVCREDTPLSALLDTEFFVNYTRRNCLIKAAALADAENAEDYIAELRDKAGRGFLPESDDDDTVIKGQASGQVIVLTDTWTRDGAEILALAAKRSGALLMGRATLGTSEFGGDVSLALDDRYILTWPTLITRAAQEGKRIPGQGIQPEVCIPWMPEECRRDLLLEAAETMLEQE